MVRPSATERLPVKEFCPWHAGTGAILQCHPSGFGAKAAYFLIRSLWACMHVRCVHCGSVMLGGDIDTGSSDDSDEELEMGIADDRGNERRRPPGNL